MMRSILVHLIALTMLHAGFTNARADTPHVQADGKLLVIRITPGDYHGHTITQAAKLDLAKPELQPYSVTLKAPGDHIPVLDSWDPWPSGTKDARLAVGISPKKDEDNVNILGALYNAIQIETLTIAAADEIFPLPSLILHSSLSHHPHPQRTQAIAIRAAASHRQPTEVHPTDRTLIPHRSMQLPDRIAKQAIVFVE